VRRLPDRILIELDEHEPSIVVALGDLYLADAHGELFKRFSPADGIVLPVLTGISRQSAADDPESIARIVRQGIELVTAIEREGARLGRVEEAHWDEDLGWTVVTRHDASQRAVSLALGSDPAKRIPTAIKAMAVLVDAGYSPAALWADGHESPGRVLARLYGQSDEQNEQTIIAKAR